MPFEIAILIGVCLGIGGAFNKNKWPIKKEIIVGFCGLTLVSFFGSLDWLFGGEAFNFLYIQYYLLVFVPYLAITVIHDIYAKKATV